MDGDLTSELLEGVFKELETSEKSMDLSENVRSGFLEDVVTSEVDLVLNKKKPQKTRDSKENVSNILETVKSLIHEGLTDSSDDEENKYFEETKYNECGKGIRELMKDKVAVRQEYLPEVSSDLKRDERESTVRRAQEKLLNHLEKVKCKDEDKINCNTKGNLLVDPVLNMRIVNPLVSSRTLQEKMVGRISVSISKIRTFLKSPKSKDVDWVTGGVIISRLSKTSQKGNQYCIWNLTDLCGDMKTICIFLFGSAYKEFWKTTVGTVVGILNPGIMDNNERSEGTLRVENAHKILVMGTSKDYGICKSKKKNGENCSSVVNTSKCDFCTFHLKKEYTKACRRSDLQPPKMGNSLNNLRQKIMGKNQVSKFNKISTWVPGKKSLKQTEKDQERLRSLSQDANVSSFGSVKPGIVARSSGKEKSIQPMIPQTKMIDLNFTISKMDRSVAKANALKFVRAHGPIKKIVEGDKTKRTPEQIASLKRKLQIEEDKEDKRHKAEEPGNDPKKSKLEKLGITDKFLELMNAGVRNKELLKTAETEQNEKYFNKLETREKLEDKMATTFKVECNAVRCLKCNYKSFSASELCKKAKHPLKVVKAVKRFWKCGQCSTRAVCLELVPLHPCRTCGSSKWEKTSMMPDKGSNLIVEPLSLRGMEEKYIGASIKNGNLNLLVPDETPAQT